MFPTSKALLPAGLTDLLPPDAEREEKATWALLNVFRSHGYERVRPPLLEFEDTLTEGLGAAGADATFRLMDPQSHRMLGLRADITPQIVRIATTRFASIPRPLRLCYAGEVLRVQGNAPRTERQVRQIGVELIGPPGPEADIELLLLAVEGLRALGVERFTIDVTVPSLVHATLDSLGIKDPFRRGIVDALRQKDVSRIAELAGEASSVLTALARAAGPIEVAAKALEAIDLPEGANEPRKRALLVVRNIRSLEPELPLTLDPVESRGFGYYAGIGFAAFAEGASREIAFGGRYRIAGNETAVGLSFLTNALLRIVPAEPAPNRVFVPRSAGPLAARDLRAQGWITVLGLDENEEEDTARQVKCTHMLRNGKPVPLRKDG